MKACFPIDILGNSLCPADSVKNLGVLFNSDFSLSKHVQKACKSCFVKLRDFRHVRRFLTHDVSVLVANAVVSSCLDYCNSLFRSLSKFNLCKLQCIQNSAARIVSNTSRYTSITPVLKKLHWLPVEQRTVCKTATLVYKYLHTGFPRYFVPYLSSYSSSYNTLRSQSGGNFLVIPEFSPSVHKSVKQFVIVLLLMLPPCGMLFLMRFVPLPPWPPSESSLRPTCIPISPKHTHLSLDHSPGILVLDPSYFPGYRNFVGCFLFRCALESSYLGRLSAIKVQLELEFMACRGSFPSCREENHPNPKSGRNLDPDKPVCATLCRGDVTDPAFLPIFMSADLSVS